MQVLPSNDVNMREELRVCLNLWGKENSKLFLVAESWREGVAGEKGKG